MKGFFGSPRRGAVSCGLLTFTCGALATPAQAEQAQNAPTFAHTALVTHWSLPVGNGAVGILPEPAFLPSPPEVAGPPVALVEESRSQAKTGPGTASGNGNGAEPADGAAPTPAHAIGPVDGSAAVAAGKGFTDSDRYRPYRTPSDIKQLAISFQILNAMDAALTVSCLKRSDCQEENPIYGKHPKPVVVVGAKAAVGALHYWIMRSVAPESPGMARFFGWFTVAVQGGVVGLNMSQMF